MSASARTTRWQRSKALYYRHFHLHWVSATHPLYRLSASPQPCRDCIALLWPLPWKYAVPVQRTPQELATSDCKLQWRANYSVLRGLRLFQLRDTPLRSMYRLYETVCLRLENQMMEESLYWFHCQVGWRLQDVPDPQDPDRARYAVLASLLECMVLAFNHKIANGLRRGITMERPDLIQSFKNDSEPPFEAAPEWVDRVLPLQNVLVLSEMMIQDPGEPFARRNIRADVNQLWNY